MISRTFFRAWPIAVRSHSRACRSSTGPGGSRASGCLRERPKDSSTRCARIDQRQMPDALYLDTSAVLRAIVETGTSPAIEERLRRARLLVTSRLSVVEAARALARLR